MKWIRKNIAIATFVLTFILVLINLWWLFHKHMDHRPFVLINIVAALLLGGIVAYVKNQK